jgi:hypothetical protein
MTPSSIPHIVFLTRHPATRCDAVRAIETRVRWSDDGALAFIYILKGDLGRLRIPPAREARRTDGLWRHTCFEAFVGMKDRPEYLEFNFAPSGEWADFGFHRYREAAPVVENVAAPVIAVSQAGDVLELEATVALPSIIDPRAWLKLALSAVIEDERGALSYWALNHPPGKPDFHHPEAFALEMEPQ